MKKHILIVILCLVLGSVFFSTKLIIAKNRCAKLINNSNEKIIIEKKLDEYAIRDFKIDSEILLLDLNANSINLEKFYSSRPIIVFRYLESSCWSCAQQWLMLCERYVKSKENFIIIATYSDYRSFKITSQECNLSFDLYFFNGIFEGLENEETEFPYLMVLDTNSCARMILPLKNEKVDLLVRYFDSINECFYN